MKVIPHRPGHAIAAVQVLAGLAFTAWLAWGPATIDGVNIALLVTMYTLAATSLVATRRGWKATRPVLSGLTGVALFVGTATRTTGAGVITVGVLFLVLAAVAASVVRPPRLWVQIGMFAGFYAVGARLGGTDVPLLYVGVACLAIVGVALIVSGLTESLHAAMSALAELSVRDPLTGALNRRGTAVEAGSSRSIARRAGAETSVIAIDLDGFKEYNDEHGHPAGDQLLVDLVAAWNGQLREGDVLGRMGGDEFVVVAATAPLLHADVLVARLRAAHPFPWSCGVVAWHDDEIWDKAVSAADDALYAAKRARRTT